MFATHAAAVILCVKTVIDAIAVNINPYNLAVVVYPVRLGALVWATSARGSSSCPAAPLRSAAPAEAAAATEADV